MGLIPFLSPISIVNRFMGKEKYKEEPFVFNYPSEDEEGDVWTKDLSSNEMKKRLKKIAKKEKKKEKKERKRLEREQQDDQSLDRMIEMARAESDKKQQNENVGPAPPEAIRKAFSWHEDRLSLRGLFPEGLKKGVSIQHKFEDGELVTWKKAENGLTPHPEYGIRNWTKSQVEDFKRQGFIMNGYLGQEGTFGYLANNAGGVRRWATEIRQANPIFTPAELKMLDQLTDADGQKHRHPDTLQKMRTEQFKKYVAEQTELKRKELSDASKAEKQIEAKRAKLIRKRNISGPSSL